MPNSTSATPASTVGWDHQLGPPWSRRAHVGRLEPPGRPLAGPVKTATLPFFGRFWPAGGWRRLRAGRGARARRRAAPAAPAAASWSPPGLGSSRAQLAAAASLCAGAAAACFLRWRSAQRSRRQRRHPQPCSQRCRRLAGPAALRLSKNGRQRWPCSFLGPVPLASRSSGASA